MPYQIVARTGHPDFLDLPWERPLADWDHARLTDVPVGLHRHVVRFVSYPDGLYAIKELPRRYAEREYRFLRFLADENVPVVEGVGVVTGRRGGDGEEIGAALITRLLEFALPYRLLFLRRNRRELREPMLDALVDLLVRCHLVGFRWGDCSLSNTLFRRDAGRLAAYLVDAETGEVHPELSAGQRNEDVETAVERCGGEVMDLQAGGIISPDIDVPELGDELRTRYANLWAELTRDEVFASDERHRIHDRLRRINELGYDVEELELVGDREQGHRLKLRTRVVDPGRHRRRLLGLTGLSVQENQARRLLNDIDNFGAWLQETEGRSLSDSMIASQWREKSFEPTIGEVPEELRAKRDPAELFHEILDHWYFMSTVEGRDMDLFTAARSYVDNVLRFVPDERTPAPEPDEVLAIDDSVGGSGS